MKSELLSLGCDARAPVVWRSWWCEHMRLTWILFSKNIIWEQGAPVVFSFRSHKIFFFIAIARFESIEGINTAISVHAASAVLEDGDLLSDSVSVSRGAVRCAEKPWPCSSARCHSAYCGCAFPPLCHVRPFPRPRLLLLSWSPPLLFFNISSTSHSSGKKTLLLFISLFLTSSLVC